MHMPADILVKFRHHPEIQIKLNQTALCQRYKKLVQANCSRPAMFRDPCLYTSERFKQLAQQARDVLGWNWVVDDFDDLTVTTRLHKDIEQYVGGQLGFHVIPEEHDYIIHELHYCIHAIQARSQRGQWLQIEWFNDLGFALPEDFEFAKELKFGDVKLQNPYVGHGPLFVWEQNDHTNISQTCKFHDLVRPGINLIVVDYQPQNWNQSEYLSWFLTHDPDFVAQHGTDKIMRYTGWPIVGRVINLDVLQSVVQDPVLELEQVLTL